MTEHTSHADGAAVMSRPEETALRRTDPEAVAPPPASALTWSRVGRHRFEVTRSAETIGFIDVAGGVFVVLAGPRYDRAIETSQTLSLEDAVLVLEGRHP